MGSTSSVKQKQLQQQHQTSLVPAKITIHYDNNMNNSNKYSNQHNIKTTDNTNVLKVSNEEPLKQEQILSNNLVPDGFDQKDPAFCKPENEYQCPSFVQFQGEHFRNHADKIPPNLETNKYRLFGDYYTPAGLNEQQNTLSAKTPQGKINKQTSSTQYLSMSEQKGEFSFIDHYGSNKKQTRSFNNQGTYNRNPVEKEEQAVTGQLRQSSSSASQFSQQQMQYYSQIQGKTHANTSRDDILFSKGNIVLKLQGEDAIKQNCKSSQQQHLLKYLLVDLKVQPTEYILTQDTENLLGSSNESDMINSSISSKQSTLKDPRINGVSINVKNKNNITKNAQISITTYPGYLEVINSPNEIR